MKIDLSESNNPPKALWVVTGWKVETYAYTENNFVTYPIIFLLPPYVIFLRLLLMQEPRMLIARMVRNEIQYNFDFCYVGKT